MELTTTMLGHIAVAHLQGPLDSQSADQLAKDLNKVIGQRPRGLVYDLSHVPAVTLAGLSTLVKAAREMRQLGGEAIIADPQPAVARTLEAEKIAATHGLNVEPTVCLAVTDLQARTEYAPL